MTKKILEWKPALTKVLYSASTGRKSLTSVPSFRLQLHLSGASHLNEMALERSLQWRLLPTRKDAWNGTANSAWTALRTAPERRFQGRFLPVRKDAWNGATNSAWMTLPRAPWTTPEWRFQWRLQWRLNSVGMVVEARLKWCLNDA